MARASPLARKPAQVKALTLSPGGIHPNLTSDREPKAVRLESVTVFRRLLVDSPRSQTDTWQQYGRTGLGSHEPFRLESCLVRG